MSQEQISRTGNTSRNEEGEKAPERDTRRTDEVVDKVGTAATDAVAEIDDFLKEIDKEFDEIDVEERVRSYKQQGGQ